MSNLSAYPPSGTHIKYISKQHMGLRLLINMKRDPLCFLTTLMNQSGAYAWLKVRGKPLLMLNDATGIKHILQDNTTSYIKGRFHQFLKPLFGDSIFLTEGNVWREQRENAAPVFANRHFPDMVRQMVASMEAMFQRWEKHIARGEALDFALEMTGFTLDALLRALFHESEDGVAYNMRSTLDTILTDTEERMWSSLSIPTAIAHRLPKYFKARKFLKELVDNLIAERRANHGYPEDLLSRLIKHYDFTKEDQITLHDEVLAFLLSGHDTTAHALSWTFYILAQHPLHRQLMVTEVDSVLKGAMPNADDLKKMKYTRQIFDEALRLYPPVWSMSREVKVADRIPLDDGTEITVPAGAGVMMCHYAVHRRRKYWENPEAFDPTRFAPEKVAQRQPFTWFPFGGGPRLCIGFRFAQMESLVALSMITQRYEFSLIPGQNIKPLPIVTLRPSTSILFEVRKRQSVGNSLAASPTRLVIEEGSEQKCPIHHVA